MFQQIWPFTVSFVRSHQQQYQKSKLSWLLFLKAIWNFSKQKPRIRTRPLLDSYLDAPHICCWMYSETRLVPRWQKCYCIFCELQLVLDNSSKECQWDYIEALEVVNNGIRPTNITMLAWVRNQICGFCVTRWRTNAWLSKTKSAALRFRYSHFSKGVHVTRRTKTGRKLCDSIYNSLETIRKGWASQETGVSSRPNSNFSKRQDVWSLVY